MSVFLCTKFRFFGINRKNYWLESSWAAQALYQYTLDVTLSKKQCCHSFDISFRELYTSLALRALRYYFI